MRRTEIAQLLPTIFQQTLQDGSILWVILEVMEAMHAPSEAALTQLDAFFDPRRTPATWLPYLAYWLNLDRLFNPSATSGDSAPLLSTGTGPLRELMAQAAYLSNWRGTAQGLIVFLETATNTKGFGVEELVFNPEHNQLCPFHIKVVAPSSTQAHQVLIERIINSEKPAHVTYELVFDS